MAKGRAAANPVTGLTAQQEEFCFQTIRLGNPNRAYRVAYDAKNMLPVSVRSAVSRLLENATIMQRLHELQEVAEAKLGVTIERIAQELARVAFADMGDLYDDEGKQIPFALLPTDIRRAVQSVTIVERQGGMLLNLKTGEKVGKREAKKLRGEAKEGEAPPIEYVAMRDKKIQLHDKLGALQTLARWKKMIKDRPDEEDADPNDVTRLTDAEVEEQLKANQAALEMIERARKRRSPVKKKAEARATKAG